MTPAPPSFSSGAEHLDPRLGTTAPSACARGASRRSVTAGPVPAVPADAGLGSCVRACACQASRAETDRVAVVFLHVSKESGHTPNSSQPPAAFMSSGVPRGGALHGGRLRLAGAVRWEVAPRSAYVGVIKATAVAVNTRICGLIRAVFHGGEIFGTSRGPDVFKDSRRGAAAESQSSSNAREPARRNVTRAVFSGRKANIKMRRCFKGSLAWCTSGERPEP